MTCEELWDYYCEKNSAFKGEGTITLTKAGLKKLFNQTYKQGFEAGSGPIEKTEKADFSAFEQIFGKTFK